MTRLVTTRDELAAARGHLQGTVAVAMTMGALHDGHAELIRHAAKAADSVVVTIFVNPLQFGDAGDLANYPRRLQSDFGRCEELGVDLVFAPTVDEIYPGGSPNVTLSAGELATRLEGADRPGHFDGVLTVVAKLLHLVDPAIAVFGEKDAQQLALIRAMVRDLDFDVRLVPVAIVREADGLALSSRNLRLDPVQRRAAIAMPEALAAGAAAASEGASAAAAAAMAVLTEAAGVTPSYAEVVDEASWQPAIRATTQARLLIAARVGEIRLIDNQTLTLPGA